MKRVIRSTVVCATFLLIFTGCGDAPATVESISNAKALSVSAQQASSMTKVVALANGSAEIVSALGYRKILVGRDIASTDTDLKDVPIVTSGHQVVAEKIIGLNPDVVIIDDTTGPAQAISAIKRAGIRVELIDEAWKLSEINTKMRTIAQIIGASNSGLAFEKVMDSAVNEVAQVKAGTRIAFLYLRGGSAIYLLGGQGSGADSLIGAVGAVDVGAQKYSKAYTPISAEALIATNPQVILLMEKGLLSVGGIDGLLKLPGVAQTDAGKNRAVIAVDDSLLLSFGPRTPDLIAQLSLAISRAMEAA
jgi:iron complex transport system substrate-binding protein